MNLIGITQLKIHSLLDIQLFINWYLNFIKCDYLVLIDDESSVDITPFILDKRIVYYNT